MVPKAITNQNLENIKVEQPILLALFPDWEHLGPPHWSVWRYLTVCLHTMTMSMEAGRAIAYLPLSHHLTPTGKYGHPTGLKTLGVCL
jgi:hypothetical protein